MSRVTIRDVARLAGVSVSTVSRALNGTGRINGETQERILELARRLEFRPSAIARGLVRRRTATIMCAVPDVTNLFYAELSREIGRVCRSLGYRLWLADTESDADVEADLLTSVRERYIDGLIITPQADTPNRGLYEQLLRERFPIVTVDRELPGFAAPSVIVDNEAIGALAVRHLAQRGHRRIAFVAGQIGADSIRLRLDGYRRALDELDLPYRADYVLSDMPAMEFGFGAMEAAGRLLQLRPRPSAAFVTTDRRALAMIAALGAHGIAVPGEFAVVGCDGVELDGIAEIPLTTVAQPVRALAEEAVGLILAELDASGGASGENRGAAPGAASDANPNAASGAPVVGADRQSVRAGDPGPTDGEIANPPSRLTVRRPPRRVLPPSLIVRQSA